jgi:hypothetical protein
MNIKMLLSRISLRYPFALQTKLNLGKRAVVSL